MQPIMDYLRELKPDIVRWSNQTGVQMRPLQFGKALCVVTLADCIPTEAVPDEERRFGDFAPGRWAWKLENVRPFA